MKGCSGVASFEMPSRVYNEAYNMNYNYQLVNLDEFLSRIRENNSQLLIVDCRLPDDYHELHVRGAINVTIPPSTLVMRRLANGQLCLKSIIKDTESRDKFAKFWKSGIVVLYDGGGDYQWNETSVISTLYKRLQKDGYRTYCLQGSFNDFKRTYPEWCENRRRPIEPSLLGLENLCITTVTDTNRNYSDNSTKDLPFPIEIIPWLFLGNADNSTDLDALKKYKIRYILNVTPNLPNTFQQDDLGIKYMQIPIQDDWSQKISQFFTDAIAFIDEGRDRNQGVLVHCLAGISRSVTITLAYLMHTLNLSLNDAYDLVKKRKNNISPNFNFMEQLVDFERQLNITCAHVGECKCKTIHTANGSTPDSGIQIDEWD
ncbi:dual specificity protein phosphatase Mpk3-like [Centruroides vittatus]|uniref:dual specificity protein phosphatase Mpk3-like n=1 Tax=Centruroides vittatus TaxID=120091 RepID=UPI00350FF876